MPNYTHANAITDAQALCTTLTSLVSRVNTGVGAIPMPNSDQAGNAVRPAHNALQHCIDTLTKLMVGTGW